MKSFVKIIISVFLLFIYYDVNAMKAIDYIENMASDIDKTNPYMVSSNSLAYDGTNDNNLRYVGSNPNNYILFNNELWRIVGVLNNIDDGDGNKKSKIKIVRSNSLGSKPWSDAREKNYANSYLKEYLEDEYYNSLSEESKELISKSVWNLGALSTWSNYNTYDYYTRERGTDGFDPKEWTGHVAPLYGSDYGFATSGSSVDERNQCLNKYALGGNVNYEFDWSKVDFCKLNDWMYKIDGTFKSYWFIDHDTEMDHGTAVAELSESGTAYGFGPPIGLGWKMETYPSLYLRSDIKITEGDGSENNPYKIGLLEYHNITINTNNGKITTNLEKLENVLESTNVKLDIKPNKGYKLKSLKVIDSNNNSIDIDNNSFVMPNSDVTISAEFEYIEPIPETGDNIYSFIIIFSISLLIVIINMKIIRKI